MRRSSIVLTAILVGGCIGGNYNQDMSQVVDMSAALPGPDMVKVYNFDLAGYDLGGLYNCSGLNSCEKGATPAQALMCEKNATPTAVAEENDLQNCFKKFCPVTADMGPGICAPTDMGISAACTTCINNTYASSSTNCSPMTAHECTMCLHQALVCLHDP
jgi:hypothetical protein